MVIWIPARVKPPDFNCTVCIHEEAGEHHDWCPNKPKENGDA